MTRFASILAMGIIAIACLAATKPLSAQSLKGDFEKSIKDLRNKLENDHNRQLQSGTLIFENPQQKLKSVDFFFKSDGTLEYEVSPGDVRVDALCQRFGAITPGDVVQCIGRANPPLFFENTQNHSDDTAKFQDKDNNHYPTFGTFYYPPPGCQNSRFYGMGFGYIQECPAGNGTRPLGYYYFSYANPSKHFAYMPYP